MFKNVKLSSDVEVPELQGFCPLLQTFTISSHITQAVRKWFDMVFVMKERCYKLQACNWVDQHQGPDSEEFGFKAKDFLKTVDDYFVKDISQVYWKGHGLEQSMIPGAQLTRWISMRIEDAHILDSGWGKAGPEEWQCGQINLIIFTMTM